MADQPEPVRVESNDSTRGLPVILTPGLEQGRRPTGMSGDNRAASETIDGPNSLLIVSDGTKVLAGGTAADRARQGTGPDATDTTGKDAAATASEKTQQAWSALGFGDPDLKAPKDYAAKGYWSATHPTDGTRNTIIASATGALFGAGPLPYLLDSVTGLNSPLRTLPGLSTLSEYYRNNHSPSEFIARDMQEWAGSTHGAPIGDVAGDIARARNGVASGLKFTGGGTRWLGLPPGEGSALHQSAPNWAKEWHGGNLWSRLGEGVAVGSAMLATDYLIDRALPKIAGLVGGSNQQTLEHHNFYLQGPLVAASLLLPQMNWPTRVALVTASIVGSKVIDQLSPTKPGAEYSALMRPNTTEAFLEGAAWMLPFRDTKSRVLAVGSAWVAGRAINAFNHYTGQDQADIGIEKAGQLQGAAEAYGTDRSHANFMSTVNHGVAAGNHDEVIINHQLAGIRSCPSLDPLTALAQNAAVSCADGQFQIARGSKTDLTQNDSNGRILAGYNLDLGGQAQSGMLNVSRDSLTQLRTQLTEQNKPAEVKEVDQSLAYVNGVINSLYQKHNIVGAFNQLQRDFKTVPNMVDFAAQVIDRTEHLKSPDADFVAKMCRDAALLEFAYAADLADRAAAVSSGQTPDGPDPVLARIAFDKADRLLRVSLRLVEHPADEEELHKVSETVAARLQGTAQNK